MNTFAFKRGWGAYGHKLSEISINEADREFVGDKPPKEFRGHLTLKRGQRRPRVRGPIEPRSASTSPGRTGRS